MSKYLVIDWETGEVLQEHTSESKAKRECRKLGCVLEDHRFAPVAFVSDGTMVFGRYCVHYNPRFTTATFEQIKNL